MGIQMKRKELIENFMMIFKLKITLWSPLFLQKYFSVVRAIPADTRRQINAGLTLVHRPRRWTTAKPTLIGRIVSAGIIWLKFPNHCLKLHVIQHVPTGVTVITWVNNSGYAVISDIMYHSVSGDRYPANTKHLYNIYTTLDQRPTLIQRCINVIQMFCVCWVEFSHAKR